MKKNLDSNIQQVVEKAKDNFDITSLERDLHSLVNQYCAQVVEETVNSIMSSEVFFVYLSQVAKSLGLSFEGFRMVNVRVLSGVEIQVRSAYFYRRVAQKRGRKKQKRSRGNCGVRHLGLCLMGFVDRYSGHLSSVIGQLSVLCPSFDVASECLSSMGYHVNVKSLPKVCRNIWHRAQPDRAGSVYSEFDFTGCTLKIDIDGGRLRTRKTKRGAKKREAKRQGYHTPWREPKMFTLYLLDAQGNKVKEFAPYHDATLGDADATFELLENYLNRLPLEKLDRVVFCGDGAPWIWERVEKLAASLAQDVAVYQVLDYTHAKQNMDKIIGMLPEGEKSRKLIKKVKDLLWEGKTGQIKEVLLEKVSKRKKKELRKKFEDYFEKNTKRMQYESLKENALPCGSGNVESAIRRVINLRLKAPGTFWKEENAECFLFLRSVLLSRRWKLLFKNMRDNLLQTT